MPKGAVLFREGNPSDTLWVLESGWVRLVRQTARNKTLMLDVVTPRNGVFGLSAFSGGPYVANAVAASPITIVQISTDVVRSLLKAHPRFAASAVGIFGRRFHHMATAYATAFAPVEQRIAAVLLRLQESFGDTLPLTRREIAELTGTTVETAIRVTTRWRRHGLLHMSRGCIVLQRPDVLGEKASL